MAVSPGVTDPTSALPTHASQRALVAKERAELDADPGAELAIGSLLGTSGLV